ncbi:hypothetical protein EJB05_01715, partial [Eragrostis curvula]
QRQLTVSQFDSSACCTPLLPDAAARRQGGRTCGGDHKSMSAGEDAYTTALCRREWDTCRRWSFPIFLLPWTMNMKGSKCRKGQGTCYDTYKQLHPHPHDHIQGLGSQTFVFNDVCKSSSATSAYGKGKNVSAYWKISTLIWDQ